jgi:integrase
MPFTDRQIASLKPKAARYDRTEPGRSGLRIRVSPGGAKTWCWLFRLGGEQKRVVFGHYPDMSLVAAHKALADAKEKVQAGIDPSIEIAAEREAERNAETIQELADEYLKRHAAPNMRPISFKEDKRLEREIVPTWPALKAKDVRRRDIIKLLDRLEDRGVPVLRNRVASCLSRVFKFAMDRGIIDASPAFGIRRLPEISRDRFLSAEEIHTLWTNLAKPDLEMTAAVKAALKFALVTGQRRAEVAGIERTEIDDAEKVWRLPASRSKNGRETIVPLPPLAMRIVAEADALRVRPVPVRPNRKGRAPHDDTPCPFLFPSYHLGKPIEPAAITRALNRNRAAIGIGDEPTIHDLRRTFATWHGELGTAPEILSALLNHAPVSITGQVYNRATLLEPRRRAMEVWCSWLERVVAGQPIEEKVIRLERRR